MPTQKSVPNEAKIEMMGHITPMNDSHGLLRTGSRFRDVTTVKHIITRKVTDISGTAFTPKVHNNR